jgi:uncharacterized membrane protein YphA (DoxX/SURF4 family)
VTRSQARLGAAAWALRGALGAGLFVAGLDKFFDVLTDWSMYLSPIVEKHLPVATSTFMHGVGVLEMLLGLLILVVRPRLGAYAAALWLLGIAVNLAVTGNFWDLALRDLEIAVSAFALGRLTEWRESLDPSMTDARSPGSVTSPPSPIPFSPSRHSPGRVLEMMRR